MFFYLTASSRLATYTFFALAFFKGLERRIMGLLWHDSVAWFLPQIPQTFLFCIVFIIILLQLYYSKQVRILKNIFYLPAGCLWYNRFAILEMPKQTRIVTPGSPGPHPLAYLGYGKGRLFINQSNPL